MPTYRYRCGTCGEDAEIWQSITDDSLTNHDAIDGATCTGALTKVLSPAGIVLKGSGFYKTDNRSSSSKSGDSKSGDSSSSDAKSGDASSGSTGSGSNGSGSKDTGSKDTGSNGGGSKSGAGSSGSSGSS